MHQRNCHRGHGTFKWENGSAYDGYWVDGKPHDLVTLFMKMAINTRVILLLEKEMETGQHTWKMEILMTVIERRSQSIGKYRWMKERATYEGPFKDGQLESGRN